MSSRKSLKMEIIKLCFVCHVVHKYNFIEIECFLYGCELNYTREVERDLNPRQYCILERGFIPI